MKIITDQYHCQKLEWDTQYFGVKAAKVTLTEEMSKAKIQQIYDLLDEYEFVTITNLNNNSRNNYLLGGYDNTFLVDVNIQFEKKLLSASNNIDKNINIQSNMQENIKIKEIAKNSFMYSRFFNDPFLDKKQAHKIYENWVNNSFKNESKYFVYLSVGDNIVGFILFSSLLNNAGVVIELIAVAQDYAGQNIGKKMMAYLENYSFENAYKTIQVGTQVDNLLAQNFYSSCGFKHKQCNSIYHLWNK